MPLFKEEFRKDMMGLPSLRRLFCRQTHISLGRPKFEGDENSINGGDRDCCVRAVKEGFAAIALEQRNFGECGGTATVYLAALEDRIVLAMPSCAMCTFKDSIGAMKHWEKGIVARL